MNLQCATIFVLVFGITAGRSAQAQPASAPASAPSTQRAPHRVVTPPGFVKVTVAERSALCLAAEKDWIVKALNDFQPTTRPTTMPSDLLDTLSTKRQDIVKQIGADLGVTDTSSISAAINDKLIPNLTKMANFRPPLLYLICSKPQILAAIHSGWSDPRFYYNRLTDDISVVPSVDLSIDHPMDDLLIPVVFQDADPPAKKNDDLQKQIDRTEANVAASMSMEAQIMLQSGFVTAIDQTAIKQLSLKPGQEWFGIGVEGLLSTRYITQINGMRYTDLLHILADDDPRNPIRMATVDLLHPISPNELSPAYAPAYIDAMRKKSINVLNTLLTQAGPDALPKILAAIKQAQPKDGEALVALIKQTVNVDLTADVEAK